MPLRVGWTRQQLLVAFKLYCQLPFGKLHSRNPLIIKYAELIERTPSALAMKLTNIASLDPIITSTGRKGLKGASAADRAMWNEMESDWEQFALELENATSDLDHPVEEPQESELDYTGVDKIAQVKIRVGQDFFRRSVLSAYHGQCCISGLAVPKLLVASHIVPWRIDEANRLNPRNGLCLSMLHDKAFDAGMLTIAEDMTVCVSRRYARKGDDFYGSALFAYDGQLMKMPEKFVPDSEFLAYH
ncbi:MAG: HNH endonuclease, partial [Desulfuromonadales bacterium]|nr:HNH endonuclease [Desulfuromonadales bacterium]